MLKALFHATFQIQYIQVILFTNFSNCGAKHDNAIKIHNRIYIQDCYIILYCNSEPVDYHFSSLHTGPLDGGLLGQLDKDTVDIGGTTSTHSLMNTIDHSLTKSQLYSDFYWVAKLQPI